MITKTAFLIQEKNHAGAPAAPPTEEAPAVPAAEGTTPAEDAAPVAAPTEGTPAASTEAAAPAVTPADAAAPAPESMCNTFICIYNTNTNLYYFSDERHILWI